MSTGRHRFQAGMTVKTGGLAPALGLLPVGVLYLELEDIVKQLVGVTILGLLLSGSVPGADQQGKSKKQGNAKHDVAPAERGGRSHVAVHVAWGPRDVEIIRTHYAPRYRNLPPGLRKKYARTGQLPPGWQKKMEPFPASLEREWAPLPAGYRRGIIDGHAVIYNSRGTIIDVAVLF